MNLTEKDLARGRITRRARQLKRDRRALIERGDHQRPYARALIALTLDELQLLRDAYGVIAAVGEPLRICPSQPTASVAGWHQQRSLLDSIDAVDAVRENHVLRRWEGMAWRCSRCYRVGQATRRVTAIYDRERGEHEYIPGVPFATGCSCDASATAVEFFDDLDTRPDADVVFDAELPPWEDPAAQTSIGFVVGRTLIRRARRGQPSDRRRDQALDQQVVTSGEEPRDTDDAAWGEHLGDDAVWMLRKRRTHEHREVDRFVLHEELLAAFAGPLHGRYTDVAVLYTPRWAAAEFSDLLALGAPDDALLAQIYDDALVLDGTPPVSVPLERGRWIARREAHDAQAQWNRLGDHVRAALAPLYESPANPRANAPLSAGQREHLAEQLDALRQQWAAPTVERTARRALWLTHARRLQEWLS